LNALDRNAICHDSFLELVHELDTNEAPETVLECLEVLAEHAYHCHPGRFADGRIENMALDIGRRLDLVSSGAESAHPFRIPPLSKKRELHVLHVMSSVYYVGGPTRLVKNWAALDADTQHSLVLTRGEDETQVRSWLRSEIAKTDGHLITLPARGSLLQKAAWLRQALQSTIDFVVLHPGPDIVPLVALATDQCPPVAIVNHADHLFWIGCSVADAVIDLRGIGAALTRSRRSARSSLLLPIPLVDVPPTDARFIARRHLGIPEDQLMLVTVGRAVKYLPHGDRSFVRAAVRILEQNPAAHLYIVGVSPEFARTWLGDPRHERIHFLGYVEDPSLYQNATDVYLESLPFGSQTALLEAALAGVPPVRAYEPPIEWLTANDDAINELVPVPATEEAYVNYANDLIRHPEARRALGRQLRGTMIATHTGAGWSKQLREVYDVLKTLRHQPVSIPETSASFSSLDVALSSWQESQNPRRWTPLDAYADSAYAMALARMFEALQRLDFRTSRWASTRLLGTYKRWSDAVLSDANPVVRQAVQNLLQGGVAARLRWARWARDWVEYWRIRKWADDSWPRSQQSKSDLRPERAFPSILYRLVDAWARR
jgi:glycosyltransferase involved in cell wall biosynthesis